MTDAGIIKGTFTKIEPIASRGVVRLHVEVPIEEANHTLHALGGYPDPANPKWVAVAHLDPGAIPAPKEEAKPETKPVPIQGVFICLKEKSFHKYLHDTYRGVWHNMAKEIKAADMTDYPYEEVATMTLRNVLNVASRAEILPDSEPGKRWKGLYIAYQNWLKE